MNQKSEWKSLNYYINTMYKSRRKCLICNEEIIFTPYEKDFKRLKVVDFPFLYCKKCDKEKYLMTVSVAIENLQNEFNLIGTWTMSQLLDLEKGEYTV